MAFVQVCKTSDVPLGNIRPFKANGKDVAIANVDGKFYCINGHCTHKGGPLGEGELDGEVVTCPWHGARFDVTTGTVLSPPAPTAVSCFKLKVEGDQILVDV